MKFTMRDTDTRQGEKMRDAYSRFDMSLIEKIEERYDGDHDLNPDPQSPPVTWAEMNLAQLLKIACLKIERLEALLEEHEAGGYSKTR
jgi:hypothetical protein